MKRTVAVIFDMDGVLLDTERLMLECFRQTMEAIGEPYRPEVYLETLGVSDEGTLDVYAAHFGGKDRAMEIFQQFLVITEERTMAEGVPVKPGAGELLGFLQTRGVLLGLASSNRRTVVEWELNQAGLLPYFQAVVCGDEVEKAKPDPEIYARAFRILGAPEAQGYAVEDAPKGVVAAKAAGLKPLFVPDLMAPGEDTVALAYRVLDSLAQVQAYFASIL